MRSGRYIRPPDNTRSGSRSARLASGLINPWQRSYCGPIELQYVYHVAWLKYAHRSEDMSTGVTIDITPALTKKVLKWAFIIVIIIIC